jgi:hypothetical protein
MKELRRQFLVWRTLSSETIEGYRRSTLEALGAVHVSVAPTGTAE